MSEYMAMRSVVDFAFSWGGIRVPFPRGDRVLDAIQRF